jgi:hypothetical protein
MRAHVVGGCAARPTQPLAKESRTPKEKKFVENEIRKITNKKAMEKRDEKGRNRVKEM